MDNIVDKHYGELVVIEEAPMSLQVRRASDGDHRSFWIPKAKLQIVEPKQRRVKLEKSYRHRTSLLPACREFACWLNLNAWFGIAYKEENIQQIADTLSAATGSAELPAYVNRYETENRWGVSSRIVMPVVPDSIEVPSSIRVRLKHYREYQLAICWNEFFWEYLEAKSKWAMHN